MNRTIGSPGVRRATLDDVPALARVLARAFFDDPVASWSCRPDRLRPAVLESFNATRLRQLLVHEEVWTDDRLATVALWAPPKRWGTTPREEMEMARPLLHPRLIARMPLVAYGMLGLERHHPRQPPHWYLAILGTDPPAQGQGLGSAVLGPVLEQCDRDGLGAYLESSKQSNIAFYTRHGFRVTGELRLPRGPKLWPMWREPRV
jgi:ribosomal protein S18 acetylase RimI-like enzyme